MSTAERLEELRILPRVSAEDRERYEIWNRQARITLAEVDPPHAAQERIAHICVVAADGAARRARGYVPRHVSMRQWFQDWRSLPDYDGPPMRAPSGVRWVRCAVDGLLAAEPMCAASAPLDWRRHIEGLKTLTEPDNGRVDEYGVVRYANWYMESFGGTARFIRQCFDPPPRGRGWCPKLAGVAT